MWPNKIRRIGVVAPKDYRRVLGLTNIRIAFQRSFPDAEIFCLEEADLRSINRLESCHMIVLPPSIYGEDTPYKHYLTGRAADNLAEYAQFGRLATFCSGTWAILKKSSYTYANGESHTYEGYVPLIDLEGEGPIGKGTDLRIEPVFSNAATKKDLVNLCYDGGPAIKFDAATADPEIRPLAHFADGSVAVLAKRTSSAKGIVVAFSSLADIHARDVPSMPKYALIGERLRETEGGHHALWSRAMAILETRELYPGS